MFEPFLIAVLAALALAFLTMWGLSSSKCVKLENELSLTEFNLEQLPDQMRMEFLLTIESLKTVMNWLPEMIGDAYHQEPKQSHELTLQLVDQGAGSFWFTSRGFDVKVYIGERPKAIFECVTAQGTQSHTIHFHGVHFLTEVRELYGLVAAKANWDQRKK